MLWYVIILTISPLHHAGVSQDTLEMVVPLGILGAVLSLFVVVLLVIIGILTFRQRKGQKNIAGTEHTSISLSQSPNLHNTAYNMHRHGT